MTLTVATLAKALGAPASGALHLPVARAAAPGLAGPGDLAVALAPGYADAVTNSAAQVALLWPGADWLAMGLRAALFAPEPRLALSAVTAAFAPAAPPPERHPMAVIASSAQIGEDVAIGPFTEIGAGAQIGAGSRIAGRVSIGAGARIGARVVLHPGCVIGADGFSYDSLSEPKRPAGPWHKVASLGGIEIGDDVEIGANSTLDAGTLAPTRIGRGTKIDNLVHIGHNAQIGEDCLLCGQVGLAGSVTLGDRVVLAGQVGVADHIRLGDDVIAGGASKIMRAVPAGQIVLGYPAAPQATTLRGIKALRRLARISVSKRDQSD